MLLTFSSKNNMCMYIHVYAHTQSRNVCKFKSEKKA